MFCHKASMELDSNCRENTINTEGAFSTPEIPGRWSPNYQGDSVHRTTLRWVTCEQFVYSICTAKM